MNTIDARSLRFAGVIYVLENDTTEVFETELLIN